MDRDMLFEAFKIAIDREHEAHEFYSGLAKDTDDADLKELFGGFAEEELRHFSKRKELYAKMKEEGA
jgi:rubrerythrin